MDADYDDLRDIIFQVRSLFKYFLEWRLCRGKVYIKSVISKNRRRVAKELKDRRRLIQLLKTHLKLI